MKARRAGIGMFVALSFVGAFLPGALGAPPDVGALAPQGCIDDNDTGPEPCALSTDGLDGAASVAVSPDGTSVYAASFDDDAVVRFDRDPATGALAPQGCVDDNDTGADDCAQSTDGLNGAYSVAVSPDGRSVYASSFEADAVVRFDRDPATGAIAPQGCVRDNDTGDYDCAQSTDGLDWANSVAVSPDGTSVYVAAINDDAVVRLARDPATGALTPQGCVDDNDTGPDDCAQSADGLNGASLVAVSADGASVYASSETDDAVVRFDRNTTGALIPRGCVQDNDTGTDGCAQSADGLDAVESVAVSPGGGSVYAASFDDDAVVRFDRVPLDTDPPETTITKKPKRETPKRKAKFAFASDEPGSTFECKLDKKAFKLCESPKRYKVKPRRHRFQVQATDPGGNVDLTPAKFKWKVLEA